jgi:L-iditol 2-dehydrogenase
MRAVQIISRGRAEIIDTPVPEVPEGQALVQPLLLAICGSDLRKVYYLSESAYPLSPGVSGHEVIGRVVSLNRRSTTPEKNSAQSSGGPVKEGDIVLALIPRLENAMAEYVTTEIENLLPLPTETPPAHLVLAQQLGTVIYACKLLPAITGKNVVVIGQGSAGLFFNTMLRRMGAKKVVSMDLSEARLSMGLSFGADVTFNNHSVDPIETVVEAMGSQLADLVVEAVGEPEAINLAPRLVKQRGNLLFFGVPHDPNFTFDYWNWFNACATSISIRGSGKDPDKRSFIQALELISSGDVLVEPMITHTFTFEEVEKAYQLAHTREDGAGKVFVKMPAYDDYLKA